MKLTKGYFKNFAPILKLHSEEQYFPMDPVEFIKRSRFRHHKSWKKDQGFNKKNGKWETTNSKHSKYYDIPIAIINNYLKWGNGQNRRPRDSNNGDYLNVFLQVNGKPRGDHDPTGSVPVFYYCKNIDTSTFPRTVRQGENLNLEEYRLISYWWFMGYNDGPLSQNHQGDWEHVTLKIRGNRLLGAYFSAHGEPKYVSRSKLTVKDGHLVVFCAKGSHASYEKAGEFKLILGFKDCTEDGGYAWKTAQNIKSLKTQPWRNYAGAWGEVGELADTTGPLGPWLKRSKL